MRIQLDSIPDEGLPVHADGSVGWAVAAAQEGLGAAPEAVRFDVKVTRIEDHVRVKGEGTAEGQFTCDRCGEPVRLSLGGAIDLYYAPESYLDSADSELGADDLDIGWFDGEALELSAVLTEAVALWAPSRVRCGDPGVTQVGAPHRCALPASALEGPDMSRPNPFAKLRLPE